jgi:hypothetical protein
MSDFNDSIQRVQRLGVAREALLNTGSCSSASSALQIEDVCIYLRWLICHFYAQKTFLQSMKLIEWLPYEMCIDLLTPGPYLTSATPLSSSSMSNKEQLAHIQQQHQHNPFEDGQNANLNRNASTATVNMLTNKFKMLDNIYLAMPSANVPRDEVLNSISFCEFVDLCCFKLCFYYFFFVFFSVQSGRNTSS